MRNDAITDLLFRFVATQDHNSCAVVTHSGYANSGRKVDQFNSREGEFISLVINQLAFLMVDCYPICGEEVL